MENSLSLSEMNLLMDIAFLFQSVRHLDIMTQKFLQMLCQIVPFEKGAVFLYQENSGRFSPCAEMRCGRNMIRDYVDKYANFDYLGWQIFQSEETVLLESSRIAPEERLHSRFYREFMKKYDAEYRLILSLRSHKNSLLGTVMLFRSQYLEDFTPKEISILKTLYHHISSGIENTRRLDELAFREDMARRVYQTIPDLVIHLDEKFGVKEGNQAAELFLRQIENDPQRQRNFFLEIRGCCQEMLENETLTETSAVRPDYREFSLQDGTAKISMVGRPDLQGQRKHEFVVVFSQREAPPLPPANQSTEENRKRFFHTLQSQYAMTRRELDVFQLAIEGMENQKIAEMLYISLFTVKSHFQNGYAKLGIKSRQELFLLYMKYLISEPFRQEFDAQTRKDDVL